jgi:hypothetical protein
MQLADWLDLMIGTTSNSHSWNQAANEISNAVRQARFDHMLILQSSDEPDRIENQPADVLTATAALDLISQLLGQGPTYHRAMRRLRDIARHTSSPQSVRAWIDEIKLDYKRRLNRAERLRNAMTHGDATTREVAATIRIVINMKARNLVRLALESVLEGKADR